MNADENLGFEREASNSLDIHRHQRNEAVAGAVAGAAAGAAEQAIVRTEWVIRNVTIPTITEARELLFISMTPECNFLTLRNLQTKHTISIPIRSRILSLDQRFGSVLLLAEFNGITRCYRYYRLLRDSVEVFAVPGGESWNMTMTVNDDSTLTTMHHSGPDAVLTTYDWDGVQMARLTLHLVVSPGVWSLGNGNVLLSRFTQQCTLYRCDTLNGAPHQLYQGDALGCVTTDNGFIYGLDQHQARILRIDQQGAVLQQFMLANIADVIRSSNMMTVRDGLAAIQCRRDGNPLASQVLICHLGQ